MSINTDFYTERSKITWGDQVVCEVRGLTPNDLAQAMAENAGDMETLIRMIEGNKDFTAVDNDDPVAIQMVIDKNKQQLFTSVISTVPNLVAKLIALACDSPDQWQLVKEKYVLPLQFDIVREIAVLTFVDGEGFNKFLGNVMALAGNVQGGQRETVTLPRPELENLDG